MPDLANPVIVQSDLTVLLEVDNPLFPEARDALARFAELEKSPEHIHTYRISNISLWNAIASGLTPDELVALLDKYSKFPLPEGLLANIKDISSRYGKMVIAPAEGEWLRLYSTDDTVARYVSAHPKISQLLSHDVEGYGQYVSWLVDKKYRGEIKRLLTQFGYPVKDLVGYEPGDAYHFHLKPESESGFTVRKYQELAVENFYKGGSVEGGCGVVVMPCGSGKTIIGICAMARLQTCTLVLSANITALRQWRQELLDKTDIPPEDIAEYSGQIKKIAPITLATYQILTYHPEKSSDDFPHFKLFHRRNWGLIIYDEVHLLPAPVFRITSDIQARRRLGLTATLVREDGKEGEVFSLVGPKRYDVPWKELESQQWLAAAKCTEIRVPLSLESQCDYAVASDRVRFRIASENPNKTEVVKQLLERHKGSHILIIGQYIGQLTKLSKELKIPLLTGSATQDKRDRYYGMFKKGEIDVLMVSKIGNIAVDLPDANVAIQISGTFGSRQEEAQRLGRILRPKPGPNSAYFYTIVTQNSMEQDFALNRQMFLTEQGYEYRIERFNP
ncbi:DEAD/DEAH box helicase [bacterium]|nr:DEAD/DEAH box helicase [bacterium]MBR4821120.1 DEAD/DEAH box helicase [bacterium]